MFPSCEVIYILLFPDPIGNQKSLPKKPKSFEHLKLLKIPQITEFTSLELLLFYVFYQNTHKKTMFIPSDEHDAALIKKNQPPEKSLLLFIFYMYVNIL